MDDLDEEFVEIITAVGPRRREAIVAAARAVAGEIRADTDQLGTAAICSSSRPRLKVSRLPAAADIRSEPVLAVSVGCCGRRLGGRR